MQIHTEIIQKCIDKIGAKSYLEIGVNNPANNFDIINCARKIGVDPNGRATFTGTSDEYFSLNGEMFDVIFIDGLHWSEQVRRDFDNSLTFLNEGGIILIHDTDPKEEKYAAYPRVAPRRWNGDVMLFLQYLPGYQVDWKTPDVDANGLTVVKRKARPLYEFPHKIENWNDFIKHRSDLLQLCSLKEFEEWI